VAALSGVILSSSIVKKKFQVRKILDATGACSNDAKVSFPGQTDLARVQLLTYQISLNFNMWLNSMAFQNC